MHDNRRRRGAFAALRALLAALLLLAPPARAAEPAPADDDLDDDSDSAPFMIVVEHEAGDGAAAWRCSGSLVSLRTGLTSAECARGRRARPARDLWVLAAAAAARLAARADGARRVSRVATAGARPREPPAPRGFAGAAWSHALLDLAVLELEMPFGSGAHSRPILMATSPSECVNGGVCHMVRAVQRGARHAHLRIVDATLAADAACARLVRYWAALRERALCLAGPVLCQSEWGAGVVCGGKLCGVVSRSAGGPGATDGGAGDADCGDTHAAHSVARWRRFLHCAHTLRACGRGACAELCHERQLLDESGAPVEPSDAADPAGTEPEPDDSSAAPAPPDGTPLDLAHLAPADDSARATARTEPAPPPTRRRPQDATSREPSRPRPPPAAALRAALGRKPTRTPWTLSSPSTSPAAAPVAPAAAPAAAPRRGPAPQHAPHASPASLPPVRPSPVFEPNRPDFRAGEYGDNAAEYAAPGDEGPPAGPAATGPLPTPRKTSASSRRATTSPAAPWLTAGTPRAAPPVAARTPASSAASHLPALSFPIVLAIMKFVL